MTQITSNDIEKYLGKKLIGANGIINRPADIDDCGPGDIIWCGSYTPERIEKINLQKPSLVICDENVGTMLSVPYICTQNPRLSFIKVITSFFKEEIILGIHSTAIIDDRAKIGGGIKIGPFATIGPDVCIGDNCIIGSGVVIEGIVTIGNNCKIKPNSVIGAPGFGFERDDDGEPIPFPHVGKVVLEDGVWIGSCTTIERATLGLTHLGKNVKVDDLVQIGHNVDIKENTLIMAGSVLCGGAKIGKNCWIAPKSVIKEKIKIGDRVTVGLGSVVIRDVEDDLVVAGVPAKALGKN